MDYRFKKTFTGFSCKNGKKRKASAIFFARKLETGVKATKIDGTFDKLLINNKAIIKKKIMHIECQIIDVSKACKIMLISFSFAKFRFIS